MKLAYACRKYRAFAGVCNRTPFNDELVTVILGLLGSKFCHFCLERSSGSIMGMLNEATRILKDHDLAGSGNFELKQSKITIANLQEANHQLQNSFKNLCQQKKDLEHFAAKLCCQVKDLEKKNPQEYEALGKKVNVLNEHIDVLKKECRTLTELEYTKSEKLSEMQLQLQHAARDNSALKTKIDNVMKQKRYWMNKFKYTK